MTNGSRCPSADNPARCARLTAQGRLGSLAIDGVQPDVGHEVLWVQGACAAVRGALVDEGNSPLDPGGLHRHDRLEAMDASLQLQLSQIDLEAWRQERRQLEKLRQARVLQRRFHQDPEPYLTALEERLVKLSLPP